MNKGGYQIIDYAKFYNDDATPKSLTNELKNELIQIVKNGKPLWVFSSKKITKIFDPFTICFYPNIYIVGSVGGSYIEDDNVVKTSITLVGGPSSIIFSFTYNLITNDVEIL